MSLPKLPELEKFPADQRESFLRRCNETAEMQRFRSRAQFFRQALVLCAAAIPILLGEFFFSLALGIIAWHFDSAYFRCCDWLYVSMRLVAEAANSSAFDY